MGGIDPETYIRFIEGPPKPKTRVWLVVTRDDSLLGKIVWFGRWWKYAFHPEPGTVFEENCMRKIATFCEDQTKVHRENRKRKGRS